MNVETDSLSKVIKKDLGTTKVCLIDYGCGNVRSVFNMIEGMGIPVKVSNELKDMDEATHLILPGVGAFGEAMDKLKNLNVIGPLEKCVLREKKPFLGICVGMQILANRGTEHGNFEGLGWIPGVVNKLDVGELPLPHVGWNNLSIKTKSSLFDGITDKIDFYFVHSYYFKAEDPSHVSATFEYGGEFTAAVNKDNIWGTQFHPEKSQKAGKFLLRNFLGIQ